MKEFNESMIARRQALEQARALHARGISRIDFLYAYHNDESGFLGSKAFDAAGGMLPDEALTGWSEAVPLAVPGWEHGTVCSYSPRHHQVVQVGELQWPEDEDQEGWASATPVLDASYESLIAILVWHLDLPLDFMERGVRDPRPAVRLAAASNPSLPVALQEVLATDRMVTVRQALARNPGLDASVAQILVKQSGQHLALAMNPNASPGVLSHLVPEDPPRFEAQFPRPGETACRQAVEHPNFPFGRLRQLAEQRPDNVIIASALASHPEVTTTVVGMLARHPDSAVRNALCYSVSPNLTLPVILELIGSSEIHDRDAHYALVRYDFSSRQGRQELEALLSDPAELVAKNIHGFLAQNVTIPPELMERLPLDSWVCFCLPRNPAAPIDLLARLVEDPSLAKMGAPAALDDLRARLLARLPAEARVAEIARWAESANWRERRLAACQHDAPEAVLLGLLHRPGLLDESTEAPERFEREGVRGALSANPSLSVRALRDHGNESMREEAARQRTKAPDLVELAADPSPRVRRAVARNINAPADVLARLADDTDSSVRAAVLENIAAPRERLLRAPAI